jgi:hypothetical protein
MNNISYETINNLKNKEILINNENAHLLGEKGALEKNLKKHSMFINALSWKKFNNNKKKGMEQLTKTKVRNTLLPRSGRGFQPVIQKTKVGEHFYRVGPCRTRFFSRSLKNNGKNALLMGPGYGFQRTQKLNKCAN